MPSAWIESDATLQAALQAYITFLAALPDEWSIDLYKNNHTPTAGDTSADYTVADFSGYSQGTVILAHFHSVTVTDHVASSINGDVNNFTASVVASPQLLYGYFITDHLGDLVLAEEFATPITLNAGNAINITPQLRHTTLPP